MSENARSGQFRKKKVYFTQVSNIALRDNKLSLKAKGLYSLIQSYLTIEDFILYKTTLKKHLKEGEKAFESTWKELKDAAYLIQYRLQDPKTKQFYYEYELLDAPDIELANKVHSSQNRKKQEEKSHNPKKVGMDKKDEKNEKAIPTKREGMDNGYSGKVGVHNNTDSIYTDFNNTIGCSSSTLSMDDLYASFKEAFDKQPSSYMKKRLDYFIEETNLEFIMKVLNYCIEHNAKVPAYLFKTLEELISKKINTIEALEKSVQEHYKDLENKKSLKKVKGKKVSKISVNFSERDNYNYKEFEEGLSGVTGNEIIPNQSEIEKMLKGLKA